MFETGKISVIRGSTQILAKVVLFQLRGRGHPQGDATPNFKPNSKSILLGLSNEVLNFSLLRVVENELGINQNLSFVPCGY